MPAVMWFRRDLRLSDNPALLDAPRGDDQRDGEVPPLFVVDHAEERRAALDRYERIRR